MSYSQRPGIPASTKWKVVSIECLRAPRLLDGCLMERVGGARDSSRKRVLIGMIAIRLYLTGT